MRSYFTFNGHSSLDFGIGIEQCRNYPTASRTIDRYTVPGRPGELLQETGTYSNVTQSYEIYFPGKPDGMTATAAAIAGWLLSSNGYMRLEDSYEPEYYRLASYAGPFDAENWMNLYGRATLDFDCMPQRWRKDGENPVSVTSGGSLYNAWMEALPLIEITGTGAGVFSIGSNTVQISDIPGNIVLDADTQNAYSGTQNLNGNITINGNFPTLAPGENPIIWSGGITGVQITPRWWRL